MAKKKITQLDPATSVNSDALFPLSQEDNNEEKTFKGTIEQLGDYINKSQDFNTLNTTSKKVIGAINEVKGMADKPILSEIDTQAPIMSFSDGGDNIPVNKLLVAVTAQQAGTGTPAPDNVRAITGWSQAQITRTGKNLFDKSTITENKAFVWTTGAYFDDTGCYVSDYIRVQNGATYICNKAISQLLLFDKNKNYISVWKGEWVTPQTGAVIRIEFTIPDGGAYIRMSRRTAEMSGATIAEDISDLQIEQGTTTTTYEAYKGITVVIPFGDTYYGGVLDVTNGKLTVTHSIVDLSTLSWAYSSSGAGTFRSTDIASLLKPVSTSEVCNFICEMFAAKSGNDVLGGVDGIACNSSGNLWVHYGNMTSVSDFISAISGAKLVYPLLTPIEINLTPEQITTLLGLNNIYADCGDIQSLEYFNENADEIAELHRSMSDDFHIYSTAEQIVGKWMGDDLYEKSYHYTQATVPAQNTAVVIDNAISNLNLASLVDMTCVYKLHHTSQDYDVWYHGALSNTQVDFSSGKLLFYQKATTAQQNYSNLEVNITIRYTKAS